MRHTAAGHLPQCCAPPHTLTPHPHTHPDWSVSLPLQVENERLTLNPIHLKPDTPDPQPSTPHAHSKPYNIQLNPTPRLLLFRNADVHLPIYNHKPTTNPEPWYTCTHEGKTDLSIRRHDHFSPTREIKRHVSTPARHHPEGWKLQKTRLAHYNEIAKIQLREREREIERDGETGTERKRAGGGG